MFQIKLQKPSLRPPPRNKINNRTNQKTAKAKIHPLQYFKPRKEPLKGPNVANAHSFLKQKARDQRSLNTRWLPLVVVVVVVVVLHQQFPVVLQSLLPQHDEQTSCQLRLLKLGSNFMPNNWAKSKSSMVVVVRCWLPNVTAS